MKILIDTNILLRLINTDDPQHDVAKRVITELKAANHVLIIVPQNIYEFWTAATRTQSANGLGISAQECRRYIDLFSQQFTLFHDAPLIYTAFLDLMEHHKVLGTNAYDGRIAAAMIVHKITHILTFNEKDFRRYAHVNVINPSQPTDHLS